MIEQKAAEMLFAMPPSKRSLRDLQRAVDQGIHAQKLFASLAADRSPNVPYDWEIADQRRKYGDSMLRRGDEHLATQRVYEDEQEAKLAVARQRRQEEKERQTALERERAEELAKQAEILAEERRKAREEAQAWSLAALNDSDDEKERKPRKAAAKKAKADTASGDDGPPPEPKKKRKGKPKKEGEGEAEGEEEAVFSGDDLEDRPVKKRTQKKRVVRDDDDDEVAATSTRPKKQFKSKETISDSDEEMS